MLFYAFYVWAIFEMKQGAKSGGDMESAQGKNQALKDAGAVVPDSFEAFEAVIKETFQKLVSHWLVILFNQNCQLCKDFWTKLKTWFC